MIGQILMLKKISMLAVFCLILFSPHTHAEGGWMMEHQLGVGTGIAIFGIANIITGVIVTSIYKGWKCDEPNSKFMCCRRDNPNQCSPVINYPNCTHSSEEHPYCVAPNGNRSVSTWGPFDWALGVSMSTIILGSVAVFSGVYLCIFPKNRCGG